MNTYIDTYIHTYYTYILYIHIYHIYTIYIYIYTTFIGVCKGRESIIYTLDSVKERERESEGEKEEVREEDDKERERVSEGEKEKVREEEIKEVREGEKKREYIINNIVERERVNMYDLILKRVSHFHL